MNRVSEVERVSHSFDILKIIKQVPVAVKRSHNQPKEQSLSCGPGKKSYMSLLRAFLVNGYLNPAIDTIGLMENVGISFDVECFNLILWGFGKLGYAQVRELWYFLVQFPVIMVLSFLFRAERTACVTRNGRKESSSR